MAAVIASGLVISILALYFVSQQQRSREMDLKKNLLDRVRSVTIQFERKSLAAVEAVFQDIARIKFNPENSQELSLMVEGIVQRHPIVHYPFLIDARKELLSPLKPKDPSTANDESSRFYRSAGSLPDWHEVLDPGLKIREASPFIIGFKKIAASRRGGDIYFGFSISLDFLAEKVLLPLAAENLPDRALRLELNVGAEGESDTARRFQLLSVPFQRIMPGKSLALYADREGYVEKMARRDMWLNYGLILALILTLSLGIYLFYRYMDREAELVRLKADFLDGVSHTLKTPLTRISLLAENVQQGWVTDDSGREEFLQIIIAETARMNEMVDNMLNFSRIEAGRKQYELKESSLPELVRAIVAPYVGYLEKLGFRLEMEIDESLPPLRLDREAVKLMVVNLLQNALKYTAAEKTIAIRVYGDKDSAVLEVEDRGIGISDKDLPHIFERFYRSQEDRVRATEGGGLGLYLVHHAVKAHGGEIKVASRLGRGSIFSICFPINQAVN